MWNEKQSAGKFGRGADTVGLGDAGLVEVGRSVALSVMEFTEFTFHIL